MSHPQFTNQDLQYNKDVNFVLKKTHLKLTHEVLVVTKVW